MNTITAIAVIGLVLAIPSASTAETTIYIDPETGQITSESPVEGGPASSSDDRGLRNQLPEPEPQETHSPIQGGGMMVESRKPHDYR